MRIFVSVFICAFIGCILIEVNADCHFPPFKGTEDRIYKEGEEVLKLGKCQSSTCQDGGWVYKGCATAICGDGMENWTDTDYSKLYPECCPRLICNGTAY